MCGSHKGVGSRMAASCGFGIYFYENDFSRYTDTHRLYVCAYIKAGVIYSRFH